MDELFRRLDYAEQAIATVKNKVARRDLLKMVKTIDQAVNGRRPGKCRMP